MTLHSLQRDLNTFSLIEEIKLIIIETADEIAELQRGQFFQGIKSDGTKIVPEYKEITKQIKSTKTGIAAITDRVTFYDTGDFWKLIGVENVNNETFTITSLDWKTDKLETKYLKKIFGLTKESREEYITYVFFPRLKQVIEQKLKLGFSVV
jgi:hypothetical protein